jgi:hypothetical protein
MRIPSARSLARPLVLLGARRPGVLAAATAVLLTAGVVASQTESASADAPAPSVPAASAPALTG